MKHRVLGLLYWGRVLRSGCNYGCNPLAMVISTSHLLSTLPLYISTFCDAKVPTPLDSDNIVLETAERVVFNHRESG